MSIRGIEMNYYAICRRKLWLFNRGLGLEQGNDRVTEGAVLHEQAYGRLDKEWNITEDAVVDAVEDEWIREVKISSRMEYADRLQMMYYLYLLKERGIEKKGLLSYPKEKKTTDGSSTLSWT
ncbi:Dna2/Cas4 domain-containing protein [Paenibacillus sediminis]|uniref:CRISPR/Cas system-associated exonuclease Cas4 (RecB family) n=1 Tax=Paenibacillus sediminis TaxID=664909 RepID=A0ABS4H593_9BACL|nr:Dna2/Cas4 domain-containing protein [Paenibacillus sediminis]MBP1937542.1 CRISPR/Cas system-associated exonuclease Cas4 (RecB family) [Paenibacillus sediminis]